MLGFNQATQSSGRIGEVVAGILAIQGQGTGRHILKADIFGCKHTRGTCQADGVARVSKPIGAGACSNGNQARCASHHGGHGG